jgi:4-alpha-glucanotransferase
LPHAAFDSTMTDAAIYKLAKRAGIAVQWRDFAGRPHQVTVESLRRILAAMALPCASPNDLEEKPSVACVGSNACSPHGNHWPCGTSFG